MKNKKIWIGVGIVALIILAYFLLSGGKKEEKVSFIVHIKVMKL